MVIARLKKERVLLIREVTSAPIAYLATVGQTVRLIFVWKPHYPVPEMVLATDLQYAPNPTHALATRKPDGKGPIATRK